MVEGAEVGVDLLEAMLCDPLCLDDLRVTHDDVRGQRQRGKVTLIAALGEGELARCLRGRRADVEGERDTRSVLIDREVEGLFSGTGMTSTPTISKR
jgi:hypothetical protein